LKFDDKMLEEQFRFEEEEHFEGEKDLDDMVLMMQKIK